MSKTISTQIKINASPEKVWQILSNTNEYKNWNPFIINLEGTLKPGNKILVTVFPPDDKKMSFSPKVLSVIENQEIRWLGQLMFKGLFDGEHQFTIEAQNDGTCIFHQKETFSGILIFMVNLEKTKKGFEAMNQKLKELAEHV